MPLHHQQPVMDVWTYELFHRTQMNLMFIICNGFSLCTEQLVAYLISYKQFSACTMIHKGCLLGQWKEVAGRALLTTQSRIHHGNIVNLIGALRFMHTDKSHVTRCYINPLHTWELGQKDDSQTCSVVHARSLYLVGVLNYSPTVGSWLYVQLGLTAS